MNKDQDIYLIIITGTFVFVCLVFFIISYVVRYKRRQDLNALERKALQLQFEQEIMKTQLEIQEQTFKTISQEIHDNIGQVLTLVKLNLGTVDFSKPEAASKKVGDSRALVSKSIQDLRHLSHSLHTDYILEMGLPGAIEYGLDIIRKSGTLQTQFLLEGSLFKFEPRKELVLFRIVQECINNIIRHADAQTIQVRLAYGADELVLSVEDDGKGYDPSLFIKSNADGAGIGLKNMRNRARLIGAEFDIDSATGKGTVVRVHLRFNAQ